MFMSFQLDVNQIDGFHWLPFLMVLNMLYLFTEFSASLLYTNSAKLTIILAQFCGIFSGAFLAFSAKQNDLKELYGFANIDSSASMKFEMSMVFAVILLALWQGFQKSTQINYSRFNKYNFGEDQNYSLFAGCLLSIITAKSCGLEFEGKEGMV